MKHEDSGEAEAFLDHPQNGEDVANTTNKRRRNWTRSWFYIRLVLEIAMAATIVFLLFFRTPPSRTLRRTPVPDCTSRSPNSKVSRQYILKPTLTPPSPTENLHFPQRP
jgi:hypothetical protein